jgi:hypothetical protein
MVDADSNEPTPETVGKVRQFRRLLMSYGDFKHVRLVADYIIENELHSKYPQESYVTLPALNCSMVVAYCRPFSGNDARTPAKVPDLSRRFLSILSEAERGVHDVALRDRAKVLAHSDSDALDPEPVVVHIGGVGPQVVPLINWGLAPLSLEAVKLLRSAAAKLFEAVLYERRRLEPELMPFFRVASLSELLSESEMSEHLSMSGQ